MSVQRLQSTLSLIAVKPAAEHKVAVTMQLRQEAEAEAVILPLQSTLSLIAVKPAARHKVTVAMQLGQEAVAVAAHVTSAFAAAPSAEPESRGGETASAPGDSAANSRLQSQGWGRLKKVKLAAKADGSQEVGTKRQHSIPEGIHRCALACFLT